MNYGKKEAEAIIGCPIFSGFRPEKIPDGEILTFSTGKTIYDGGFEKKIGVVLSGTAKVYSKDEKKNVLLRTLSSSDVFGVSNLFTDEPFVSRIVAKSTVRVVFFDIATVETLLETDGDFVKNYIFFLSERIRFLNRKILFYTSGSAERRLSLYLSSFGTNEITTLPPASNIAELLDIGRASLYRAFDRLSSDGFIVRKGKTVKITNPEIMKDFYRED